MGADRGMQATRVRLTRTFAEPRWLPPAFGAVSFLAIVALTILADCVLAVPMHWIIAACLLALGGLQFLVGDWALRPRVIGRALAALLFVAIYVVPWNTRKLFLRDFRRVEPGMTVSQVREVMSGYMVGTGWRLPESPEDELEICDSMVFRHSNTGAYDSDWGIVRLRDGVVVGTEFLPD